MLFYRIAVAMLFAASLVGTIFPANAQCATNTCKEYKKDCTKSSCHDESIRVPDGDHSAWIFYTCIKNGSKTTPSKMKCSSPHMVATCRDNYSASAPYLRCWCQNPGHLGSAKIKVDVTC